MFQYKNSQIIAIIQINLGHNLNDNNEAVLFFDLFLFIFSLKRMLVLVCFGWWVVDWDKRFS
jgi:hypothetical protein